jgi:hypothetical protein
MDAVPSQTEAARRKFALDHTAESAEKSTISQRLVKPRNHDGPLVPNGLDGHWAAVRMLSHTMARRSTC